MTKENLNKFIPMVILVAVGVTVGAATVYSYPQVFSLAKANTNNNSNQNILSTEEISDKLIKFINEKILQGGSTASILSIAEEGDLYKVNLKIDEQEFETYATKDGKLLFPQFIDMSEEEITKSDRPDVKLFIMSYCPYGLQAEKMYLPVYQLLKDKANLAIYFVDYAMHDKQELDENLKQYCIQNNNKEQYYNYLSCFVKDGDSDKCLNQASIDKSQLDSCIQETDKQYKITENYNDSSTWLSGVYPPFNVQKELNEQYDIGGSPTVVINDQVIDISPRSPENFKQVICQAFNNSPEECSQTLSEEVPPASFGWEGSSNEGNCE